MLAMWWGDGVKLVVGRRLLLVVAAARRRSPAGPFSLREEDSAIRNLRLRASNDSSVIQPVCGLRAAGAHHHNGGFETIRPEPCRLFPGQHQFGPHFIAFRRSGRDGLPGLQRGGERIGCVRRWGQAGWFGGG